MVFALRPSCRWSGCSRPLVYVAQMLCRAHYQRIRRSLRSPGGRATDGRGAPTRDVVGYFGAHARVRDRYGLAALYGCELCPHQAAEWALPPSLAAEVCPVTGLRYSLEPEDYMPLCASCHRRLDRSNPAVPGVVPLPLEVQRPVIRREPWAGEAR